MITASDGERSSSASLSPFSPIAADIFSKLTGIDVVGRLRAHAATRDVRIILISAGFSDNVASRGPPAGADDDIKKPFGVLEIPDRVQAVLAR